MSTASGAAVVVGVDGSADALRAVRVAATEATVRQRPLRVVHALGWPRRNMPASPAPAGPLDGGPRYEAERIVARAIAEARAAAPDLDVTGGIAEGEPAEAMLGESPKAALLVLGDRGLGGFSGLIVGSVAVQVSGHAACPVLVVRGRDDPSGPVVVGVDGSELSELAVGFAVEEAALHGTDLVAVHAFNHPVSAGAGDMLLLVYDVDELRSDEERLLAESVAGWRGRYPEVAIRPRLIRGRPAPALIDQTATARLVVVGARGRGGFTGLVTGSVSQALLHHAQCPVAVVHRPDGQRADAPARDAAGLRSGR
ncbi:universal stress protein [Solwaraspora sp. WMMD1047]|uniref:universal stress protein n=1 Tax=Solwaraspora sp. WMMD1047 TaxID=3016102 RepID=UPI002417A133|nr:universal stress protein [Solwaraspora sp. WMMD1047]MDG4831021.1 universal stress protein [Solwaraspora sp. WMMD1047]